MPTRRERWRRRDGGSGAWSSRPNGTRPRLTGALEAILLVVDEPVTEPSCWPRCWTCPRSGSSAALGALSAQYTEQARGFDLRRAAGGWRLYTRADYAAYVERFVLDGQQVRLTQAALETLAVIAYKQPVTRSRISAIRGVNCDGVVRTLVTRGLIEECGSEPDSGAFLYRTTTLFLEKLGLDSVDELPPLAPFLPDDVDEIANAQSLRPATDCRTPAEGAGRGRHRVPPRQRGADRGRPGHRRTAGVPRSVTRSTPTTAEIHVDGERVVTDTNLVHLAMNKPRGVVSTMADEQGREALADYVGTSSTQRVFHVGRLDADSEGLLLLTNDGTLAHRLTHPVVRGAARPISPRLPDRSARGRPAAARRRRAGGRPGAGRRVPGGRRGTAAALVEVVLHEGRKHIVRRMFEEVGHPVDRLIRTAIGPIQLGDLKPGRTRRLTHAEIAALFKAVGEVDGRPRRDGPAAGAAVPPGIIDEESWGRRPEVGTEHVSERALRGGRRRAVRLRQVHRLPPARGRARRALPGHRRDVPGGDLGRAARRRRPRPTPTRSRSRRRASPCAIGTDPARAAISVDGTGVDRRDPRPRGDRARSPRSPPSRRSRAARRPAARDHRRRRPDRGRGPRHRHRRRARRRPEGLPDRLRGRAARRRSTENAADQADDRRRPGPARHASTRRRAADPLRHADDAIELDTTGLDIDEVVAS